MCSSGAPAEPGSSLSISPGQALLAASRVQKVVLEGVNVAHTVPHPGLPEAGMWSWSPEKDGATGVGGSPEQGSQRGGVPFA